MLLIGAGGHARVLVEVLAGQGTPVTAYSDTRTASWLSCPHFVSDADALYEVAGQAVLGMGGVDPDSLLKRLGVLATFEKAGWNFKPVCHPSAICSPSSTIEQGAHVLAGSIVQPGASIGRGAIINTGAIIEHESSIGAGAHVAPGAIVLGAATVGECAMIGAGAVVLPGSVVENGLLVPAGALSDGNSAMTRA